MGQSSTEGGTSVGASGADDAESRLNREYAKSIADPRVLDALKATERRQFKNFCKRAPGRAGEFKFAYLDAEERSRLLDAISVTSASNASNDVHGLRARFARALQQFEDELDAQVRSESR